MLVAVAALVVDHVGEGAADAVKIDAADVPEYLGKRLFTDEELYSEPVPGVVMGLAWTMMGGDTLYIEATKVATGRWLVSRCKWTG